jgi:hypothetical protein
MQLHRNAKLGLRGRQELVLAVERGLSLKAAAAAFSVSPATAHRWWLAGGAPMSRSVAQSSASTIAPRGRAAAHGCCRHVSRPGSAPLGAAPAGGRG